MFNLNRKEYLSHHEAQKLQNEFTDIILDHLDGLHDIDETRRERLARSISYPLSQRMYSDMVQMWGAPECEHEWGKVHKRWWKLWQTCKKCNKARKVKYEECDNNLFH